MHPLHYLDPVHPVFPAPRQASDELGGLLAAGGNLEPATLITAYRQGIFPWFEEDQPILWWSPPQRAVILPGDLHISRSLRKSILRQNWAVTSDQCFDRVVENCAAPRKTSSDTWITDSMITAYGTLHRQGYAHSIEVWQESQLVGGLYGVAVGAVFCGESMFSHCDNASKVALVTLATTLFSQGLKLIDCQLETPHLQSMGARLIPRDDFLIRLVNARDRNHNWPTLWHLPTK